MTGPRPRANLWGSPNESKDSPPRRVNVAPPKRGQTPQPEPLTAEPETSEPVKKSPPPTRPGVPAGFPGAPAHTPERHATPPSEAIVERRNGEERRLNPPDLPPPDGNERRSGTDRRLVERPFPVPPAPSAPPARSQTTQKRGPKPDPDRRRPIVTSVPSSLADAVREHANNESLLLAEVLLLAVTTAKPAAVTPLPIGVRSGRRRRSVAGVTTLTFYLASDEIALLDTRANATGRNRSHYVSDLLAAWLDNDRRKRVFEPLRNL